MEQLEGFYQDGKIELRQAPEGLKAGPVQVIILPLEERPSPRSLVYGKYQGEKMSTDEDFHIAEWRGEDWPLSS